jgi:tetratricopeptide (TPR) repeat protein
MKQRALLSLGLVSLLVGCPGKPDLPTFKSVPECQAQADKSLEASKAARTKRDLQAADAAAVQAEDALRQAQDLTPKAAPQPGVTPGATPGATPAIREPTAEEIAQAQALRKLSMTARATRRNAMAGYEEEKRDAKLNGLVGKTYRKGSGIALKGLFLGLSKAAEQAVGKDVDELPENVRGAAQMAADLAGDLTGRQPLPDGKPDWAGIASDMKTLSEEPSPRTHLTLAAAFLILKRDRLALYEIHQVEGDKLAGGDAERAVFLTMKGIIYRMNGYPILAGETFEGVSTLPELAKLGPEMVAGIHLLLMGYNLKQKEYTKADEHLVRAIKAWPDNPVAVYLTGEQQLANGETELAKESFEKAAAGTDAEWLSKELKVRVKDIQDGKETDALFTDLGFMRKLVFHYLALAARKSPEAKQIQDQLERAKAFGTRTLDEFKEKIPGFSKSEGEGAAKSE